MSDLSVDKIITKSEFIAEQWIEQATVVIGDKDDGFHGVGEDPRYEDEFNVIKYQLGNLKGTDYHKLLKASSTILFKKAKDLRVAGYATLSAARLYGVKGIAAGLTVCCYFMTEYSEHCHPVKTKQRNNILNWFSEQQKKFIRFIEEDLKTADDKWIMALSQQLKSYQDNIRMVIEPSLGSLKDVEKLVGKYVKIIEEKNEKALQQEQQQSEGTNDLATTPTVESESDQQNKPTSTMNESSDASNVSGITAKAPTITSVQSDTELMFSVRELIKYFKEQKDFERMVAMSRGVRWASQPLPPSDNGKTRVPALRQTAFAELNNLASKEDWEQAFYKAEAIFMEGGAHLSFDLQQISANAARKMGRQSLALLMEGHLSILINKHPELIQLKFSDGEPFCSPSCLSWIESFQNSDSNESNGEQSKLNEVAQQAASFCQEKNLPTALEYIASVGASSELEAAELKLMQAQFCLNNHREEAALSILKQLENKVESHHLDRWAPDFAMNVWRYLDRAMQASNQDSEASEQYIKQLRDKMFVTNPSKATQWL